MAKVVSYIVVLCMSIGIGVCQSKTDTLWIEQLPSNQRLLEIIQPDPSQYIPNGQLFSGMDSIYISNFLPNEGSITDEQELKYDTFLFVIEYVDGYKAKVTEYYSSGELRSERHFKDGKAIGCNTTYYKSGVLESVTCRSAHGIIGPVVWFYPSGRIKYYLNSSEKQWKYAEKNIPFVDISTSWFESGVKYEKRVPITDGNRFAVSDTQYYKNGQVAFTLQYNNGRQPFKSYYKNGKLMWQGYIVDGPWYREGKWSYYDEDGNLVKEEVYEENELINTIEYIPQSNEGEKK